MERINVEGLPELLVRSLEAVAEQARHLLGATRGNGGVRTKTEQRPRRSVRKGTVIGELTREEIYEDRA